MYLWSHPMWVRGLKHGSLKKQKVQSWSHPMWVRGLKRFCETSAMHKA